MFRILSNHTFPHLLAAQVISKADISRLLVRVRGRLP